mmetsp:Transcript_68631/g.223276  ORF Transcript_68631/g.223276 Transcript_68631/m.223276 type:complete len:271 (+) Transcript_68631:2480-3292(+)
MEVVQSLQLPLDFRRRCYRSWSGQEAVCPPFLPQPGDTHIHGILGCSVCACSWCPHRMPPLARLDAMPRLLPAVPTYAECWRVDFFKKSRRFRKKGNPTGKEVLVPSHEVLGLIAPCVHRRNVALDLATHNILAGFVLLLEVVQHSNLFMLKPSVSSQFANVSAHRDRDDEDENRSGDKSAYQNDRHFIHAAIAVRSTRQGCGPQCCVRCSACDCLCERGGGCWSGRCVTTIISKASVSNTAQEVATRIPGLGSSLAPLPPCDEQHQHEH